MEWHKHKCISWSESYAESVQEALEKDIFPYVGKRPVAEILPLEMLEVLRLIENAVRWKNYVRSGSTAIRSSVTP